MNTPSRTNWAFTQDRQGCFRALDSEVSVTKGAKTVGGAKLIALMGLGAKCGDTITVTVSGGDERASENMLKEFLEKNL